MSAIGIIGGSGLYSLEGIENIKEYDIETPFGKPSAVIMGGQLSGKQVYFIPRHGKGHTILPSEIPHRANFWALKSLGVSWVIGVGAVGSLKEELAPMHIVLPDQYFDRTVTRTEHTFFGDGIVAHVPFGYPTNELLRTTLEKATRELSLPCQNGGTYVNMEGPAFSTKSESEMYRSQNFDIIGMTNLAEAKLAREAEMAYASLSMVTDYDCWKDHDVDITEILEYLGKNTANAKLILAKAIAALDVNSEQAEFTVLNTSILTQPQECKAETVMKLRPLLARMLDRA